MYPLDAPDCSGVHKISLSAYLEKIRTQKTRQYRRPQLLKFLAGGEKDTEEELGKDLALTQGMWAVFRALQIKDVPFDRFQTCYAWYLNDARKDYLVFPSDDLNMKGPGCLVSHDHALVTLDDGQFIVGTVEHRRLFPKISYGCSLPRVSFLDLAMSDPKGYVLGRSFHYPTDVNIHFVKKEDEQTGILKRSLGIAQMRDDPHYFCALLWQDGLEKNLRQFIERHPIFKEPLPTLKTIWQSPLLSYVCLFVAQQVRAGAK